ncbi:MAG: DUF5320 domain-containing protein [Lentimicrobiaceae bacterium]|nr:DUF5320 domain-containing protein [Lentimicrobiaceae bacterium]
MPNLDGTGPEGMGHNTGRKLGPCNKTSVSEKLAKLGKGMGKKRNSGGGKGQGRRLRTDSK